MKKAGREKRAKPDWEQKREAELEQAEIAKITSIVNFWLAATHASKKGEKKIKKNAGHFGMRWKNKALANKTLRDKQKLEAEKDIAASPEDEEEKRRLEERMAKTAEVWEKMEHALIASS